jgi:hypothetical protein
VVSADQRLRVGDDGLKDALQRVGQLVRQVILRVDGQVVLQHPHGVFGFLVGRRALWDRVVDTRVREQRGKGRSCRSYAVGRKLLSSFTPTPTLAQHACVLKMVRSGARERGKRHTGPIPTILQSHTQTSHCATDTTPPSKQPRALSARSKVHAQADNHPHTLAAWMMTYATRSPTFGADPGSRFLHNAQAKLQMQSMSEMQRPCTIHSCALHHTTLKNSSTPLHRSASVSVARQSSKHTSTSELYLAHHDKRFTAQQPVSLLGTTDAWL